MGKSELGLLGHIQGKVGPVVGVTVNGENIIRAKPKKSTKPKSAAQKRQHERFSLISEILNSAKLFIRTGFKDNPTSDIPRNRAMSLNIMNAITGEYPGQTVDYSKLQVSEGDLVPVIDAEADVSVAGELTVTWDTEADYGSAKPDDKLMLLVMKPGEKYAVEVLEGNERESGSFTKTLPKTFQNNEVHVYAAFKSSDDKMRSDSVYVGSYTVSIAS